MATKVQLTTGLSNFSIENGNSTVMLNELATKMGIHMKFGKHPLSNTGVILYLGDKKYEAIGLSVKNSRMIASREALKEFSTFFSKDGSYERVEIQKTCVSKVYELSQRLGKPLKIDYFASVDANKKNIYVCKIEFNNMTFEGSEFSKQKAKEICCDEIIEKMKIIGERSSDNGDSSEKFSCSVSESGENKDDSVQLISYEPSDDVKESPILFPRDYQEELYKIGLERNIIICLGTGCGKTYISVMIIRDFIALTAGSVLSGAKRIAFIVPTVALLYQQASVIRKNLSVSVGIYCGDAGLDVWALYKWNEELEKYPILMMTGEVFRLLLQHGSFKISQFCLVVFDECHHAANKGHYYNVIMTNHYKDAKENILNLPRIIGLTATPAINVDMDFDVGIHQIRQKISQLEQIFDAKCLTTIEYIDSVRKVSPSIKLNMVLYDEEELNHPAMAVIQDKMIKYLDLYNTRSKNELEIEENEISKLEQLYLDKLKIKDDINRYPHTSGERQVSERKLMKVFHRTLSRSQSIFCELGTFPLLTYFNTVTKNLDLLLQSPDYINHRNHINYFSLLINKLLKYIKIYVDDIINSIEEKSLKNLCSHGLVSSKVLALIEILLKHYEIIKNDDGKSLKVSTLIFVKERTTASILSGVLNTLCRLEASHYKIYPRLTSNFVVGVSDCRLNEKIVSGIEECSLKTMTRITQSFRYGGFSVLFATSVLEEGIDVSTCNVVIRFDKFNTIQSFCQSKGRIRSINSYFYVIEGKKKSYVTRSKITSLLKLEHYLSNTLCNYIDSVEQDDESLYSELSEEEKVYITKEGMIDIRGSVSYIHRYVSRLAKKYSYKPSPKYFTKINGSLYQVTLRIPKELGIYEDISSDWLHSERAAKQHCSLRAIKLLHIQKLIDDHFIPCRIKNGFEYSPEIIFSNNFSVETSETCKEKSEELVIKEIISSKDFYIQKTPKMLNAEDRSKNEFFLSEIRFKDYATCQAKDVYKFIMDIPSSRLAILTPKPFNSFSFPLASSIHSFNVEFIQGFNSMQKLREDEVEKIFNFNKSLFEYLKVIPDGCTYDTNACHQYFFIVVVDINGICYDKMDQFSNYSRNNLITCENHTMASLKYGSAVVKNYSSDDKIYFVVGVNDVKPNDKVQNHEKSFIQYYKEKYNIDLKIDDPMLTCFTMPMECNMLHKIKNVKTKNTMFIHIPLSCVNELMLNSSLIMKIKFVPSILKRFVDYLRIYEWATQYLRVSIVLDTKPHEIGSFVHSRFLSQRKSPLAAPAMDYEKFYVLLEKYTNTPFHISIPFYSIFQALTRASSNECCDYERMEFIGDRFVKFICAFFLFTEYPSYSEGKLTSIMDSIVSNKNLCNIGKNLKIQEVMNSKPINFGKNWCPPGYHCTEISEILTSNDSILNQSISDKAIADVVEALIGCCLLFTNFNQTLDFISQLEIFKDHSLFNNFSTYKQIILKVNEINFFDVDQRVFASDIALIEEKLNYKFKDTRILCEALMHVSYLSSSQLRSYERLEFLGDSIVGLMVTMILYTCNEQYGQDSLSPFQLSHMEHALVNNKIMGIISVKNSFTNCLKYNSSEISRSLTHLSSVVESLDNSEFHEVPFLGLVFEPEQTSSSKYSKKSIEMVPVPKIAADVLESIAAAVFIDTHCDLTLTAKAIIPLFKEYIDSYMNEFPFHPKVYVMSIEGVHKKEYNLGDSKYKTVLTVPGKDEEFCGIAKNLDDSFIAACYCVYKEMEKSK